MSRVTLGDVAKERRETCKGSKEGYPIVGLEHLIPEEITLTSWDEEKENSFTKRFHEGDILFGRRRAYLKKAAVAPFEGICSGDITVIEAIPERILPELLPFIIQNDALFEFAVGKSAGSLSPRVKWQNLKNYEFELPNMKKQRELAKLLWAVDSTKKAYQKLISKTDELVKSQFIEMFGNPIRNGKYKKVAIREIGETLTGTTPPKKKAEYYDSNDILFIKPGDIADEGVTSVNSAESYISENARGVGRIFPEKSVLVTCIGTIGKVGIAMQESSCNQQINVIVPNHTVNHIYLAYCMLYIRDQLRGDANAPVVPILNKGNFSKIEVMLPPMELQEQFETFVIQSDKSKFELEQALKDLDATYKKIILDNLG
jgi:type I restriction enzyme S subunit